MKLSIKDIASLLDAEIIGNPAFVITGVSSFDDSNETDITFASDIKFLSKIEHTRAGAIIVPSSYLPDEENHRDKIFLKTENPKVSFFKLVSHFHPVKKTAPGIHSTAEIGLDVKFGSNPFVGAHVCIGDKVRIGASNSPVVTVGTTGCSP